MIPRQTFVLMFVAIACSRSPKGQAAAASTADSGRLAEVAPPPAQAIHVAATTGQGTSLHDRLNALPEPNLRACDGIEGQQPLNACAADRGTGLEAYLDTIVKVVDRFAGDSERQTFDTIQANWKRYAYGQCDWEASFDDGGSMHAMDYWGCMEQKLRLRIRDILGMGDL